MLPPTSPASLAITGYPVSFIALSMLCGEPGVKQATGNPELLRSGREVEIARLRLGYRVFYPKDLLALGCSLEHGIKEFRIGHRFKLKFDRP